MPRTAKPAKPRKIKFNLILDSDPAYVLLQKVRDKWHQEIERAKIALAFWKDVKADRDGIVTLARIQRASDLYRELMPWDFIVLLNEAVWRSEEFTEKQRKALLDHELCHVTVSMDKTDQARVDERNRPIYRMRRHDIEEFRAIVKRHGCYKADLEEFAKIIMKKMDAPLIAKMEDAPANGVEKPAPAIPVN